MHAGKTTDDLEVAQFLGPDVHKQVFSRVLAIDPWIEYCIAAAGSPFAPPNCSRSMLPKRAGPARRPGPCT